MPSEGEFVTFPDIWEHHCLPGVREERGHGLGLSWGFCRKAGVEDRANSFRWAF